MSRVQEKYQEAESSYESDLFNLVVPKCYLPKMLANGVVKSHVGRHEPESLTHLMPVGERRQHAGGGATAGTRVTVGDHLLMSLDY